MDNKDLKKTILNLAKPVLALSPMDGVSDSPFRQITKIHGKPDLIFTEFCHVMGIIAALDNIIDTFHYEELERPIIAQVYGKTSTDFYHVAKVVSALGFDGIDINMGCPAKNVIHSGAGAGLIKTPDLALEIIKQTESGLNDWVKNGQITGLSNRSKKALDRKILEYKERLIKTTNLPNSSGQYNLRNNDFRKKITLSVKTRIGYDTPITQRWIGILDKTNLDWISVHGRTLKQMYSGYADILELKKAVNATSKPVLINGDIKSHIDIKSAIDTTEAAGILIGRASFGNPWVFLENYDVTMNEKIATLIEHAEIFINLYPTAKDFVRLRKHFAWYMKGFDGASDLRNRLIRTSSISEVQAILKNLVV